MQILVYLLLALATWAHPTNNINRYDVSWIVVETGKPAAGTADSWPGRDGKCHIRIDPNAWAVIAEANRDYTVIHEVGHCLGRWDPFTYHLGDGWMSGVMQMTAYDQFLADDMHSNGVMRRAFVPMVAQ